jgi:hypothetical protein
MTLDGTAIQTSLPHKLRFLKLRVVMFPDENMSRVLGIAG